MYLLIDNYDSFTYNVYQYLSEISDQEILVKRNDEITLDGIEKLNPEKIIISPGPGRPEDAGVSLDVIKKYAGVKPILGICLGHQCIGQAFGSNIIQAKKIVHGKTDLISNDGKGLFRACPKEMNFTRYHSLAIDKETLSSDLEITAFSHDGEIMGIRHKEYEIEGVQFHPESMASEYGKKILKNFLNYKRRPFMAKEVLLKLIDGNDLSFEEAENFMEELTEGNLTDPVIASFLTAFNAKGIAAQEIAGCANVLKKKKVKINTNKASLDTCGTGGDGHGTFNISSLSAIVAAACGAMVAKHGNRAVSSKSGSADFYSELGIKVDLQPEKAEKLLNETGFSFLFAPLYHGAMKYAGPARKALGIRTIMNFLGPLVNPADAEFQLIGVSGKDFMPKVAEAAIMLGKKKVMVVYGADGLDEISVTGKTHILVLDSDGNKEEYEFNPEDIGMKLYTLEDLKGGSAEDNAFIAKSLLEGNGPEAIEEAVSLNAGAALYVYGLCPTIESGYNLSKKAFKNGLVKEKINQIIEAGKKLSE